jgi:protein tyrosine phosphatase
MIREGVRYLFITVFAILFITDYTIYLNLLIIQGYDNSESFIITQDPLESTIADFWRMVSEQSISTLVMLSDVSIAEPLFCLEMSSVQEKRECS